MANQQMRIHLPLVLFLVSVYSGLAQEVSQATISVDGTTTIADVDDHFVCATIDWWPPEKCDYNQCPWGSSSAANLDLSHPLLAKAIEAFGQLRIRIGGSLQDQVLYNVGSQHAPCHPFRKMRDGLFGFSKGCLLMSRWDELNNFFKRTGAILTFGLNALHGRHQIQKGVWGGAWDSSNARDLMRYTISKGYKIDSWEFGNELSGSGVGASVAAELYAKDVIELKGIINDIYKNTDQNPSLVAPGGFFDQKWYAKLLEVTGSGVIDVMTHHIYNLGPGVDPHLVSKILDPHLLSKIEQTFNNLARTIEQNGSWASAWVGESGGAYNSGGRDVSDTFVNSFWYLDQLGMASNYKTKVYCRQTLVGGNYGLLNRTTFVPNPDYYRQELRPYSFFIKNVLSRDSKKIRDVKATLNPLLCSALLWHRLMGKGVLSVHHDASPYLRSYAHCSKRRPGITLLLINLSNSTDFIVSVQKGLKALNVNSCSGTRRDSLFMRGLKKTVSWVGNKATDGPLHREEYHLTAKDGFLQSKTMVLNGIPLQLTGDGDIPPLDPVRLDVDSPLYISPLSIAFIVFPNFDAPGCA